MEPLLVVKDLMKSFPVKKAWFEFGKQQAVHAVNGVSFSLAPGETLGLVGESGCGKSTLGRLILRLLEPTSGSVHYRGQDLMALDRNQMRAMRRKMQIIFQDPYASLNPRLTVGDTLLEPLEIHGLHKGQERQRIDRLLNLCGLSKESYYKYPHEFSGGQRQRICIARALAVEPEFIVCDEPVSALDVSIQAQILNLMMDLQQELKLTYLFISHDLKVVEHVSDRVAVMYLGRIVEMAPSAEIYKNPGHPYTQALLSAIPRVEREMRTQRQILMGDVPSPMTPPPGCTFHPRCSKAQGRCSAEAPRLEAKSPGHDVSCFFT